MANLHFEDRFDGTLSAWTTYIGTSNTVVIATQDLSSKLRFVDNAAADYGSAKTSITFPTDEAYIIEFDMMVASTGSLTFELLDASNTVLATAELTSNTLTFNTDTVGDSTTSWTDGTYNQVTLLVDPVNNTIKCYWYDLTYGSSSRNPRQMLAEKAFSGTTATQIIFRTDSTKTGNAYVDEVRSYTPDWCIVGPSIADGKPDWSSDPSTTYRLTGTPVENGFPSYHLGVLLGSNNYVGNLGFGGARMAEIEVFAQETIVDLGFKKVIIFGGLNDFNNGGTALEVQADLLSITDTLVAGGIFPGNIYINTCYWIAIIIGSENTERVAFNNWLPGFCADNGYTMVDTDATHSDNVAEQIVAAYDWGDGTHCNSTGSQKLAQNAYDLIPATIAANTQGYIS